MTESSLTVVHDEGTRRTLGTIRIVTLVYLAATVLTLVFLALVHGHRAWAGSEAWTHAVIVLLFAVLLVGVVRAVAAGSARAYLRLRIVSVVIPVVSVVLLVLPGLPTWMKVEQAVYAVALLVVAVLANSAGMRAVFRGRA